MEKLNVTCDSCNKGKLVTLDLIHDDYKIGCDTCDHVFTTHYTGYDCILESHEYNNQVCKDVQVLNSNGTWRTTKGMRHKAKDFDLEAHTKGWKHLQSIETYEISHYYQFGAGFIQISHNTVHGTFEIYNYIAKEESIPTLMKHFFKVS